jgi:hypothetical protein
MGIPQHDIYKVQDTKPNSSNVQTFKVETNFASDTPLSYYFAEMQKLIVLLVESSPPLTLEYIRKVLVFALT